MKYVKLGKKGPEVSAIGFGAWAIGGMNWCKTDDEVSKKALNEAIECGVTFIDTADVYGFGHSEELIREVIAERGKNDIIFVFLILSVIQQYPEQKQQNRFMKTVLPPI